MSAAASLLGTGGVTTGDFRAAMAALAAPVTVVTCFDETGAARGLTASAVSSLSLDPPLILVCLDRGSSVHDVLVRARAFSVNLMGPGDEELVRRFAGPSDRRFDGVRLTPTPSPASPALADSALRLGCEHYGVREGGDHTILIGRVTSVTGEGLALGLGGGLVWHQRGFAHARAVSG